MLPYYYTSVGCTTSGRLCPSMLSRLSAAQQHRSRDCTNHVNEIALKMEKGSFLLGALGKSFKDILRGALDSEQVE